MKALLSSPLGVGATLLEPRFWSALVVSLIAGLAVAYPVNVLLVRFGVKSGMMDPREEAEESGQEPRYHPSSEAWSP